MRDGLRGSERLESLTDDADLCSIALHAAVDEQKQCVTHLFTEPFIHAARDDDVRHPPFVLQEEEHGAFGALGTLTDRHETTHEHLLTTVARLEILAVDSTERPQPLTKSFHGMTGGGESNRVVVQRNSLVARQGPRCKASRPVSCPCRRERQSITRDS